MSEIVYDRPFVEGLNCRVNMPSFAYAFPLDKHLLGRLSVISVNVEIKRERVKT